MPNVFFPDPTKTVAFSMLLKGESGVGKTHSIGTLIDLGYKVGLIAVERKFEAIARKRPLIMTIDTVKEFHDILHTCRSAGTRKDWIKRVTTEQNSKNPQLPIWDDIDLLAVDSLMELERLVDKEARRKNPDKKGDGSFQRWDDYGIEFLAILQAIRDTIGDGDSPIPIIATMGSAESETKQGGTRQVPLILGKVAPPRIPFYFTIAYELDADLNSGKGQMEFKLITGGPGIKSVGQNLFPPILALGPSGFSKIWKTLEVFHNDGEEAAKQFFLKEKVKL